ncbi:MAG: dTDP-4-dehydrorhamnose reductase [Lentimicrobiaceae bacterium]|jgi:dTDP-4-dehydrorhamnose reductase|nr:dTDP-4-dehydrorhamnose reductase [Lentimicrobiaceae bacterium]MBT4466890.1 dTDP-4-dehydrorhamnose reductase [Lentimicrobiaceae bacterium]MBT4801413.1 dTDP-4-dehydrorhamnose reductase [Lentimicrobiaceae bacterium]MBT6015669.1 dTDP-4-dehydrorhamnose reductase [Lentimicrobiaceae bacterium]MCP4910353.1 dTDP-4-dehydrorhamnose reductase [Bacteroidota bacterium]
MMKNILITGSNGQLGSEIREISDQYENYNFIFTDVEELDLTISEDIVSFFTDNKIDACINCAAYTAVDKAEDEVELAMLVNSTAVENLSKVCKNNGTLLFHISTDYVFNGKHFMPYVETDTVSPDSQYGLSKLKGEEAVMLNCDKAIIVRTSWLYSSHGNNFVKTLIKLGNERDQLSVVSDQVGTPTYAADLAEAIMVMIASFDETKPKEIYHFSNEGAISWYDFGKAIMKLSDIECAINPIDSKDYPSKANRPFYSVLSKSKIKKHYGVNVPYWEDSLRRMIIKSK